MSKQLVGLGDEDLENALKTIHRLWNELPRTEVFIESKFKATGQIPKKLDLQYTQKLPYLLEFSMDGRFTDLGAIQRAGDGRKVSSGNFCTECLSQGKKFYNWSNAADIYHKKHYH